MGQSIQERNRNNRIKDLMSKKATPLVLDNGKKTTTWNVNKILEDRQKLVEFAESQKIDRKKYWQELQDSINR